MKTNAVTLTGFVGREPRLSTSVGSFSMAVNESYRKEEEWKTRTSWFNVVVFGNAQGKLSGVHKGSLVQVDGSIRQVAYEKDGQTIYDYEIHAQAVTLMEKHQVQDQKPARKKATAK